MSEPKSHVKMYIAIHTMSVSNEMVNTVQIPTKDKAIPALSSKKPSDILYWGGRIMNKFFSSKLLSNILPRIEEREEYQHQDRNK
jgi:hypothetical protein